QFSSFLINVGLVSGQDARAVPPHYLPVEPLPDACQPTNPCHRLYYMPANDAVVVMEARSPAFRALAAATLAPRRAYRTQAATGDALAVCHNAAAGVFIVTTSDLHVEVIEEGSGVLSKRFRTPATAMCCAFVPQLNMLLTGDTKGGLQIWDYDDIVVSDPALGRVPTPHMLGAAEALPQPPLPRTHDDRSAAAAATAGHTDAVLGLLYLEGLGLVASSSMDRTVKLWDLSSRRLKNTL
ncbi:unnamed protein product, partial [Phaeothamnion confervicola]